ncbi:MAG: hypothetical protein ACLQOO_02390 [Terriglobia bacterium]
MPAELNRVAVLAENHEEFAILVRYVICGLLVAAGVTTSLKAQTQPGEAGHCAGLPSFGPKDSLNTADLKVETKDLRVQVSAKGPELHLRLEPDPGWKSTTAAVQRVGWIRVLSCETGAVVQSLEVQSACGPECFLRFFEARDGNFDGYRDIAVLRERGALWGSQTWWAFSPGSGKFISNDFTKALSKTSGNGLELDATRHNIIVPHLTGPGRCARTKGIYHVGQSGRLVLIHTEDMKPIWDPRHTDAEGNPLPGSHSVRCTLTTRDRVNGQMQVTKVQQFREPATHQ